MAYSLGGRVVAQDNIAVGSPTGRENLQAGSAVDSQALPRPAYVDYASEAPASTVSVGSMARVTDTVTVTATGHGLRVGQHFLIAGADQVAYNIEGIVATSADADTFTYTVYGSPTTPPTGTMTVQPLSQVNKVTTTAADFPGIELLAD